MRGRIKTELKRMARLLHFQAYYDWDSGAYADYGVNVKTAVYSGGGGYEIENAEIHSQFIHKQGI